MKYDFKQIIRSEGLLWAVYALAAVASLVRRGLVRRTVRGNSGRGTRRTSNEYAMLAPEAAVATEPEEPD
jgi:hypothetical protein